MGTQNARNSLAVHHQPVLRALGQLLSNDDVSAAIETLTQIHSNGQLHDADGREALKAYVVAAAKEMAIAEYCVGLYYHEGRIVRQTEAYAMLWFEKAVTHGCEQAKYPYALCCFSRGDYSTAASHWRDMADKGHAQSLYALSHCTKHGLGVCQNSDEAEKLLSQSAEQGCVLAKFALAKNGITGQSALTFGLSAIAPDDLLLHKILTRSGSNSLQLS